MTTWISLVFRPADEGVEFIGRAYRWGRAASRTRGAEPARPGPLEGTWLPQRAEVATSDMGVPRCRRASVRLFIVSGMASTPTTTQSLLAAAKAAKQDEYY